MPKRRLWVVLAVGGGLIVLGGLLATTVIRTAARDTADAAQVVRTCNICGTTATFETLNGRPGAGCPACKSRERHRLLMLYLQNETSFFTDTLDVLHFAPAKGERELLRRQANLGYRTASNERWKHDLWANLTSLVFMADESWDVLIVYHVLEHIPEDRQAMHEMYRVLRPGGQVFLQVPLERGRTEIYEDPSITGPRERAKHFGQSDHVRIYSAQGLKARLEAAGFEVLVVDYLARLDPALVEKHGLASQTDKPVDESIWIATKPRE
jgi:predicted SAM-dependent methyltransferase